MFGVNVSGDEFVGEMLGANLLLVGRCVLRMQQRRCSAGGCLECSGHGLGIERGRTIEEAKRVE